MEIIKSYLENMFMHLPHTPEVSRAKEELLTMMEDKYNELKAEGRTENEAIGIVISEFGNLEELAESLGISSYLRTKGMPEGSRIIRLEEARSYIEVSIKSAHKIAIATMLCIWSPILLILLSGIASFGYSYISGTLASAVGLVFLLVLVAIAVALFITNGMALDRYEYLKKEPFRLESATDAYLQEQKNLFQPTFIRSITLGVILCILGVIPLLVLAIVFQSALPVILGVVFLLVMVSVAVFFFITAGIRNDCYKVLLQEEEFSVKSKSGSQKLIDVIAGIYWPITVCIYLFWSFSTGNWGHTWIIWPIAGVLFGAISTICAAVTRNS